MRKQCPGILEPRRPGFEIFPRQKARLLSLRMEGVIWQRSVQLVASSFSVVQWHPFSLFFCGCPTKNDLPKKGFLFLPGSRGFPL